MIRINLLGEKVDHSATYILQGILYVGCLILAFGVMILHSSSLSTEVQAQRDEKNMLEARLAKLEEQIKQVDELEKKRKLLKDKLTTIATLKAKKHGPVHLLDDLNNAIPDKAWVTEMREKSGQLELTGVALDNQTIAQFMANLGNFASFDRDKVDLVQSFEFQQDNVKLKQFTLSVMLKDPLRLKQSAESEEPKEEKTDKKKKKKKDEAEV